MKVGEKFTMRGVNTFIKSVSIFFPRHSLQNINNFALLQLTMKFSIQETKIKTIIGDGQSLRIDGKPEESGYYFCSAKMNGAVHNSRIVTLDISGK